MEIKNAIVKNVRLEIEDHGILTAWLMLDYGGSGQGFGGYSLEKDYAPFFIRGCLKVCGVDEWNQMVGKTIRVKSNPRNLIEEIGHIIKDIWFNPRNWESRVKDGDDNS